MNTIERKVRKNERIRKLLKGLGALQPDSSNSLRRYADNSRDLFSENALFLEDYRWKS
jgi:hypothetical protein